MSFWKGWKQHENLSNGKEHWSLYEPGGLKRADVWGTTWHTWDEDGIGGENGCLEPDVPEARQQVQYSLVRQEWADAFPEAQDVKHGDCNEACC